ncbi:S-adenosyl-L-methionine-dependent methyltransferase [Dactylonectria macrodidyma]|uniref:S-adenosyl-L-methionine-dependent methyltransferase n=1 Tax=Dactylonectria macrodidyma TaxID=307937 RepID=A0A9P9DW49_9HYPO|nr:S-adenosyl-L-methionine-dependent methyltransferase [Dactylonectria macrodidyma]
MAESESVAHIEVDDLDRETVADSSMESRLSTYTASLTSSVVDYPYEHGRRYHAFRGGSYILPNDETEMNRLDLNHALMTKVIGDRLYLAPLVEKEIGRVLDLGTGTGIWAIEMGDAHPQAEILGNDLSPIQPSWVPPNVKFEVDDIESGWMHQTPFDFIFCRYMACCILDWPKLTESIYDNLKPGGWAEFQDYDLQYYADDGSLKEEHSTLTWINTLLGAARTLKREPCPGPKQDEWVKAAGFQNVKHHVFKIPIGPWAKDPRMKDLGMCNLAQTLEGLEGFSLRLFCGILKWSEEEVLLLLSKVRKELKGNDFHAIFNFHVTYGQKP